MKNPSLTSTEIIEELVFSIYHSLHISTPSQISTDDLIERTASKFKIKVYYFDESSEANNLNGFYCIFLNKDQAKQNIWYDFTLGFAHILGHMKQRTDILPHFSIYQKWQVEEFAQHFCVPSFMLNQLDLTKLESGSAVQIISTLFNVEHSVATTRLEKWLKQI